MSTPTLKGTLGRAAGPRQRFSSIPRRRAEARKHGRYILYADVAEFYRTIYTHSIPWALHTKAFARQPQNRQDAALLGNRLDLTLRNGQQRQTNGIPIGPDTSFIIGEIILSAIDIELAKLGNYLDGFRFYDDLEFTFDRASDAEDYLAGMQAVFAEYNLHLNAVKTQILSLPLELDHPWRDRIREYRFGIHDSEQDKIVLGYFDTTFGLKRKYPNDPVLSYAISRLDSVEMGTKSWKVTQALILQAVSVESDCLPQVAVTFAKAYSEGLPINLEDLAVAITLLIRRHAPQNHGYEVAWSLWLALSFACTIDDAEALQRLSTMEDSVVALLALDAFQRGFLPGLDLSRWQSLMTADQLEGEHWLLSYEARVRGWLGTAGGGNHIVGNLAFQHLRQNGVNFYGRVRAPTRTSIAEIPTWRPSYNGHKEDADESDGFDLEDFLRAYKPD